MSLTRIAIVNITGYIGAEVARLLCRHPMVKVVSVTGRSEAGKKLGSVMPHLSQFDLTIEAASFVNQDLTTDAMPEFTKAKLSTLTASRLMASNASKETVSIDLNSWIAGTMNRVSVADNGAGGGWRIKFR